jgi:flagellin
MSYSIQTNIDSAVAQQNLAINGQFQSRTIQRLTSGYRINSSGDDAAGLAVANKFRSDVAELQQGVRNANDGISALGIVDGGLNNISNMLDRLKTLATQSASGTFSGNRATLNTEYQTLLTEINRQASNIGLSTGAVGGRYSTNISVYIGGGAGVQANAAVNVNLSGARVDSTGLGILSSNIMGGGSTTLDATTNLNTTGLVLAGSTQTITFRTSDNQTHSVTLNGGAAGMTGQAAVDQINAVANGLGISAVIGANGALGFYGDQTAFAVSASAVTGAGVAFQAAGSVDNSNMYTAAGGVSALANGTETIAVNGQNYTANVLATDTVDSAITKLNASFNQAGVYAVKNAAGTGITLQSANSFTITGDGGGSFAGTPATASPVNGAGSYSGVANSQAALTALGNAVTTLGNVQGKIGTGQNELQYAVQLAQSQITSFSAAESRIRDADVAAEAANLTKAQVLSQSSIAALAQANQAPQAILSLLRG